MLCKRSSVCGKRKKRITKKGEKLKGDVAELCIATDMAHRATKQTALSIGRSMAMVMTERHLWLNIGH